MDQQYRDKKVKTLKDHNFVVCCQGLMARAIIVVMQVTYKAAKRKPKLSLEWDLNLYSITLQKHGNIVYPL